MSQSSSFNLKFFLFKLGFFQPSPSITSYSFYIMLGYIYFLILRPLRDCFDKFIICLSVYFGNKDFTLSV